MGFLSSLFRRNKSPHTNDLKSPNSRGAGAAASTTPSSTSGGGGGFGGRLRGRRITTNASTPTDRDSPTELLAPDDPASATTGVAPPYSSSSSAPRTTLPHNGSGGGPFGFGVRRRGPDLSEGSQRVAAIKSPRSDETSSSGGGGGGPLAPPQQPLRNHHPGAASAAAAPWVAGGGGIAAPPSSTWPNPASPRPLSSSSTGPIDLDASDVESVTASRDDSGSGGGGSGGNNGGGMRRTAAPPPRLSSQRLEEFEKQQSYHHHHHAPVFTMEDASHIRFSAGNLDHPHHHPRSPSSEEDESSSFNLSTDAEDTDYENLKRRGVLPPMDTSTYSGQYNTDGETSTSVFPNLPTDDEATITEREEQAQQYSHHARHLQRLGGGMGGGGDILSLSNTNHKADPSIDARAWAKDHFGPESFLPSSYQSNKPLSSALGTTTNNGFLQNGAASNSAAVPASGTAPAAGSAGALQRRSFTTPLKKAFDDDFANFADFNNITFPSDPGWNVAAATPAAPVPEVPTASSAQPPAPPLAAAAAAPQPAPPQSHVSHIRAVFEEKAASPPQASFAPARPITATATPPQLPQALQTSSSSSAVYTDTSLSELLAQAKSKSTSRHLRRSGHSVNSAPVTSLSAAYLRQHHNLKPRPSDGVAARLSLETGSAGLSSGTAGGSGGGGGAASVSDIIHSLEAANSNRPHPPTAAAVSTNASGLGTAGRLRPSSRAGVPGPGGGGDLETLSVHSRDNASVRSAKDRLRRRREHRSHRNAGSESSESDENGSESWLMDEVTGALGPRGIAPDLESLSGRSNRSRSSGGGRSHKSHKSHRSHRSNRRSSTNRRVKSSSGDSVSSHGSRRSRSSRHSRSSRYSHRSTRSYLSQMSEQSRSVANDLLRLEMQLAMVGSGAGVATGGGGSLNPGDDAVSKRSAHTASSRHSSRPTRTSSSRRAAAAAARRTRMTIVAPPGKLGIILANKADSRGTVVSGVRTSSVMAEQISPGDRIVAIDGEDVSLMTVSEITTIMTRKADFERTLTVLTTPRHTEPGSPRAADYDYIYK